MASIRPKGRGFEARVHSNGHSVSRTFHSQEAASAWASAVEQGYITAQARSPAVKSCWHTAQPLSPVLRQ